MVLPMPESTFALYSVDSVTQRTPLALSWPILFFGACRSIMRIRTFGGGQRGAMEPGGMAAVRRWQLAGPEGPVALRRRLAPGLPINFT